MGWAASLCYTESGQLNCQCHAAMDVGSVAVVTPAGTRNAASHMAGSAAAAPVVLPCGTTAPSVATQTNARPAANAVILVVRDRIQPSTPLRGGASGIDAAQETSEDEPATLLPQSRHLVSCMS
jgi:hypothetical protein